MSFSCMFQAECTGCGTTSHDSSSNLFAAGREGERVGVVHKSLCARERSGVGGIHSYLNLLLQHTVALKIMADFAVFGISSCVNSSCGFATWGRGEGDVVGVR